MVRKTKRSVNRDSLDSNATEERAGLSRRSLLAGVGAASVAGVLQSGGAGADAGDSSFNPIEATVEDIYTALESGELTARTVVEAYLERIDAYDEALNTVITLNENALDRADELDRIAAESGPVGPLHGVPMFVKDNMDTGDIPTTGSSIALSESQPPDDAYLVQQLRDAGAIVVAKANLHELARGGTTVSSLGGATRNAYDLGVHPGGSSGGSSAAVAANLCVFATSSDTGGSTRMPAAYGNLFGLRGTLGLISQDGIIPIVLSRDIGGVVTKTVRGTAVALDTMTGYDPQNPITARAIDKIPSPESPMDADSYTEFLEEDGLEGSRIGIFRDYFGIDADEIDTDVETEKDAKKDAATVTTTVNSAIEDLERLGATIVDPISIVPLEELDELIDEARGETGPEFNRDINAYFESLGADAPISSLEAFAETEQYACDIANGIEAGVTANLEDDELEEMLQAARGGREVLRDTVLEAMAAYDIDAILYPTLTRTPSPIGEDNRGSRQQLSPAADMPAISIPAGFTEDGYPVGFDLLGPQWSEPELLKFAYAYEQGVNPREPPAEFGPLPADPPAVPDPTFEVATVADGCE